MQHSPDRSWPDQTQIQNKRTVQEVIERKPDAILWIDLTFCKSRASWRTGLSFLFGADVNIRPDGVEKCRRVLTFEDVDVVDAAQ